MRIAATSDWHGNLPQIPECDLLLLAGDYFPLHCHKSWDQLQYLKQVLLPHLQDAPCRQVLGCWGNHDWIGEDIWDWRPNHITRAPRIKFLTDQITEFEELSVVCSPWTKEFNGWAFNLPEGELHRRHRNIPENVDVVLTHGPPFMMGDGVFNQGYYENVGSVGLRTFIEANGPRLVVNGHIHEGFGHYKIDPDHETSVYNVSLVDSHYRHLNTPVIIDL